MHSSILKVTVFKIINRAYIHGTFGKFHEIPFITTMIENAWVRNGIHLQMYLMEKYCIYLSDKKYFYLKKSKVHKTEQSLIFLTLFNIVIHKLT